MRKVFTSPLSRSLGLHLFIGILVMLLLFFRDSPVFTETVFEVTDILQKKQSAGRTTPSKPNAEKPARAIRPRNPEPAMSTSNTAPKPAPEPSETTSDRGALEGVGPVAQEYEVADLPRIVKEIKAEYPAGPKSRGVAGPVVIDLVIDSEGKVRTTKVISATDPELAKAAEQAVLHFVFSPARMGEKAVAIKIRYTYRFVLQ